ncbi:MAG: ISL3 family transposase [Bacteriovoracaceae bacterium]|jgi:transposase|nr:ISL3 family transposase [Bacteriovoracaceae bacterium]
MLGKHLNNLLGLPELEFIKKSSHHKNTFTLYLQKKTKLEYCPKCATKSTTCYDKREVTIKDIPLRGKVVHLKITKRRFYCKSCKKPFTEPIQGIRKGFKSTTRFRKHIFWCASNFDNLKNVQIKNKCSSWMVYTSFYEHAELEVRKLQNPWGKTVGIDEHSFIRNVKYGHKEFVTIFVDYNKSRIREVVKGRYESDFRRDENLYNIPGRENVQNVITDFAPSMRSFAKSFFPNAKLIADKFHLVRLANNMVNLKRLEIMKDPKNSILKSRKNPLRKMLLMNSKKLKFSQQRALMYTFDLHRELEAFYKVKEMIVNLYNIRGYKRAKKAFAQITNFMSSLKMKGLQSLRRTMLDWKQEILNYFKRRVTNGKTEGSNRKAKLIQRQAYGFKKLPNYRLKLIYLCR